MTVKNQIEVVAAEEINSVSGGIASIISLVTASDLSKSAKASSVRFSEIATPQMNMVAFD